MHALRSAFARFDRQALRPPQDMPAATGSASQSATGAAQSTDSAAWQALSSWCHSGAGPGGVPLFQPWALPRVEQRLSVASLTATDLSAAAALAAQFALHLDGSHALAALPSRWAGLAMRVRIKLNDVQAWRRRVPTDPWDAGYLVDEPMARHHLPLFSPRRATLLVVDRLPAPFAAQCATTLAAHSSTLAFPVRLLVVTADPAAIQNALDQAQLKLTCTQLSL